jgi:hypothetical protein
MLHLYKILANNILNKINNFNYMEKLFTQTTNVLRDNWIVELQKNNNFLKNKLHNINLNPFFGYKVKVKSHFNSVGQAEIPGYVGKIYNIDKSTIWILTKNQNNEKVMKTEYITHIEFIDERFESFFS